ncbi:protein Wnt-4 [Trichonephila clavipes]|uniref:Protein Wnt n=1 Tax=Trichonephila clavipes TaxID=2585209 RepID=A0A8X6WJR3_TRICX|nr:protein Wnt-4 [Trichonephila clavipes]
MVWAGIMMDGRTYLHFFDTGSVTAQRYRDEVLEPYVRLFRGAVGPDFMFMDDNAPCHRAVLIDDCLETENIQCMPWPVNSPNLNPIEHAVRSSWRLQCKCHGVSGSCEAKTCWKALPSLQEVAAKLKLKHRDAEEAHPVPVGRKTKLLPTTAVFNKDDLVYNVKSPDYCVYDPSSGSAGTKGRQCNSTATDSFGCEAMCCSRGYLTTWTEYEERCGCKFQRCCYVTCNTCKISTHLNLCL